MSVGKILGFQNGAVIYRTPSGEQIEKPIRDILQITIDGQEAFNQAEQLRQEGKNAEAAKFYDTIISSGDQPWLIELARYRTGSVVTEPGLFSDKSDQPPEVRPSSNAWTPKPSSPAADKTVDLDRPRQENVRLRTEQSPAPERARATIPNAAARQQATKLLNEVYVAEIAKATGPAQKASLAKKLLQAASDMNNDPASRYVLLTTTTDLAAQAEDDETAIASLDELAKSFQVDCLKLNAETLAKLISAADSDYQALLERTNRLTDEAIAVDRYDVAQSLARLAVAFAKKTKKFDAITAANAQATEVGSLKITSSLNVATNPSNTSTHLAVGRFYCFIKGDWEKGLPHLASGNDAALKALAEREMAKPTESARRVELADGWWALALKEDGPVQRRIQDHAADGYRKVLPELTGLAKATVEKRLDEIGQENAEDRSSKKQIPAAAAMQEATTLVNDVYGVDIATAKTAKDPAIRGKTQARHRIGTGKFALTSPTTGSPADNLKEAADRAEGVAHHRNLNHALKPDRRRRVRGKAKLINAAATGDSHFPLFIETGKRRGFG
ncbi:MAG: hypothetical protein WCK05_16060, partial [Planctomycetota bacterium]